ncbi:cGMP-dependent protein kinase, isozyme 1-like [Atheta coriaria]|uniref:cGMP-dependent protein kinase, isozyme 1-like n=1 Tax=Dalotia coriaria TaxID=877792 RepID=UPI0031F4219C
METGGCRAEVAAPTPPLRVAARTSSTGNEGAVTPVAARRFKTTHTCGSLFANCGCSRFQRNHADDKKRSSSPSVNYSRYRSHEKRLSNPEVSLVEPAEEVTPSQLLLPLIRPKYKRSQTQSESSEDIARKFLQDFGILGPMGNGVTLHRKVSLDAAHKRVVPETPAKDQLTQTIPSDYEYLKNIVPKLEKDLRDLEIKNGTLNSELHTTRKELQIKDAAVLKYQREVHKLKSVLQQTTSKLNKEADILSTLHQVSSSLSPHGTSSAKKQGVSAESSESSGAPGDITIPKFEKDFRSKQLIKDAILDNDFLKNLDSCQIREIVDSMYPRGYQKGTYVIREGDNGAHLFVSAEGEYEVIKDGNVLGRMGTGKAFGELAILYNCTRTASIRVVSDSNVWVLDRKVFQQIMVRTGLQRLEDNINFLRSVPLLQNLNNDVLAKIADVLEVEFYPSGAYIIRQGATGDTFFIMSSGRVKITQRKPGTLEDEQIRTLQRGDYFGEQALLKEDYRTASVIALHPGVECLTLDRDSFIQLIGDLSEIKEKDYGDTHRKLARPISSSNMQELAEYDYIQLDDLDVVATLGIGGFGRVELVQYSRDQSLTFALKCLKKQHIVDTHQQEHIFSEKSVMMGCRSKFICRMYKTFKDAKYVYMLLEACLGGEVWTILRDRSCFDEYTTRFITACVVEAFDYLHARGIIYRDLKPENLLLDGKGYVKLVDFGFSKRLGYSSKTWTFCGTPEYVSPETILNKGHDRAVDYWALGILMHELLTGNPPFAANDPMRTYNLILKGIDMIDFAKHNISRTAQSLIKKLCRDLPSERLGYQRGGIQDIKKHKWFQGFDWDGLISGNLQAPIVQSIRGPSDFTNFDTFSKDNNIPADETSGWEKDF